MIPVLGDLENTASNSSLQNVELATASSLHIIKLGLYWVVFPVLLRPSFEPDAMGSSKSSMCYVIVLTAGRMQLESTSVCHNVM